MIIVIHRRDRGVRREKYVKTLSAYLQYLSCRLVPGSLLPQG